MINVEDWVTIRTLKARKPELGSRAIAELLGISRNTVKNALANDRAPQYQRQTTVNPQIEPFTEFIRDSYLVKHLRVSRILADMRSKGYKGWQVSALPLDRRGAEAPTGSTDGPRLPALPDEAWRASAIRLGRVPSAHR